MAWTSVHIHLDDVGPATDAFLVDHLEPELDVERAAGRLRRWFFLRYSEGGPHIRLRLRSTPTAGASSLGAFEERLAARARGVGGTLRRDRYDRAAHYFGDTPESVYAELLNEATSALALALVQSFGPAQRGERWIALTCALGILRQRSCASPDALRRELADSRDFSARAARALALQEAACDVHTTRRRAWVEAAWPQVEGGLPPALTQPLVALLRRLRRRGEAGREVAIHALHLLCNKAGFSLAEERESFDILHQLSPRLVAASSLFTPTARNRSRS